MILMSNAMMGAAGYQAGGESGGIEDGFRYLKFDVTTLWGATDWCQIQEIELYDASSTMLMPISATSPDTTHDSFPVDRIINGATKDVAGRALFAYSDMPIEITIDYGTIVLGHTVEIYQNTTVPIRSPKDLKISASVDNLAFTTVFEGQTSSLPLAPYQETFLIA